MKAVIHSAGSVCLASAGLQHTKLEGRLGPSLKSHLSKGAEDREAMIARDRKWDVLCPSTVLGLPPSPSPVPALTGGG